MAPTMEKLANLLEFAMCFDKIKVSAVCRCCGTRPRILVMPTAVVVRVSASVVQARDPERPELLSSARRLERHRESTRKVQTKLPPLSARSSARRALYRCLIFLFARLKTRDRFTDAPLDALSLFVAEHCPMLKVLARATERSRARDPSAVSVVAQIANSYHATVSTLKPKDPRVVVHHLRVMTGAILLYDHSSRDGAFCSKSHIKVRLALAFSHAYMTL